MYGIAIIDDEKWIRKLIIKLLPAGDLPIMVVGEAEDGEEGLELLRRTRPQIVVTDIRMPVLSGLELIERMKSVLPQSEVIIVSGYDNFDYARQALKFGVRDFLLKPVEEAELRKAVERAIDTIAARNRIVSEKSTMERQIRRMASERATLEERDFPQLRNEKLRISLKYIHEHFSQPISLKSVCDQVTMNPSYYSELFKKELGQGFNQYLVSLRLNKAKELLAENAELSIADVSRIVGFQDPNYFSRLFRRNVGRTAQDFRAGT